MVALAGCGANGAGESVTTREAPTSVIPPPASAVDAPAPPVNDAADSTGTTLATTNPSTVLDAEPATTVPDDSSPADAGADAGSGGGLGESVGVTDSVTLRVFDPED